MNPSDLPIEVDVRSVKQMLDRGDDVLLLDCRETEEYAVAKIAGAVLIPLSQLRERFGELQSHQQQRIVVHCHHGGRSLQVAMWLRRQDFPQVQSMAGGIDAWSTQVDASVPRY
jgi:rhodanese-related sulfurtransferase